MTHGAKKLRRQPMGWNLARRRLWEAMRIYRRFTTVEIVEIAIGRKLTARERGGNVAPLANARQYLRGLHRACYLEIQADVAGHRAAPAIYHLIRDTGPVPPRIRHDGSVIDANLETS